MLSNAFLILLTVIFILMEASSFPTKMQAAFSSSSNFLENFDRVVVKVNSYMAIKTWVSLATGFLVSIWLFVINVDFPLLWGVLAFLFNYVPNIGSIIAAIPACRSPTRSKVIIVQVSGGTMTAFIRISARWTPASMSSAVNC